MHNILQGSASASSQHHHGPGTFLLPQGHQGGQDLAGVRNNGQAGTASALLSAWQPFIPTPPSLLPWPLVLSQGFPTAWAKLLGSGKQPRGLAFPRRAEAGEHAQPNGLWIPTLGAGGLFITLAPLQTDVSF